MTLSLFVSFPFARGRLQTLHCKRLGELRNVQEVHSHPEFFSIRSLSCHAISQHVRSGWLLRADGHPAYLQSLLSLLLFAHSQAHISTDDVNFHLGEIKVARVASYEVMRVAYLCGGVGCSVGSA